MMNCNFTFGAAAFFYQAERYALCIIRPFYFFGRRHFERFVEYDDV